MDWFLAGLTFGFVGSVHCIGMCGPLAMSLPGVGRARWRFLGERLLYNLGRATTYALLGALFGALGLLVALAGYQQWLSLTIGLAMVLSVLVPWVRRRFGRLERVPAPFLRRALAPVKTMYRRGGAVAMFGIGLLNGVLPCGLVYAALATATTAGSVGVSALFMAAFGLGTLPAMFAASTMGRLLSAEWRLRLQKLVPVGVLLVGALLVLRGLSLGVFLSPDLREALFTPGVCRYLPFVDPSGV
mgnify:CR=1 FL=1